MAKRLFQRHQELVEFVVILALVVFVIGLTILLGPAIGSFVENINNPPPSAP